MKISEPQNQTSVIDKDVERQIEEEKFEKKSFALWIAAIKFTDSTTMHGLRYVFRSDTNIFRRLVWLSFILGGMAYCIYIMCRSVSSYLEHPTVMRSKTKYETSSPFPTVTICPYNVYQKSKLTEEEKLLVSYLYPVKLSEETDVKVNFSKYDHIDVFDFMNRTSFQTKPDWCLFDTDNCPQEIMGEIFTDMGFCMRFGSTASLNLTQKSSGLNAGLDVVIMTNTDSEWMAGPYMYYTGFRVAVDQEGIESNTLRDRGFSLIPEIVTDAVLSRRETTLLPPPHGQCGEVKLALYDKYTRQNCLAECEANFTIKLCGCRYFHQRGDQPLCTFSQLHVCLQLVREMYSNTSIEKFSFANCHCPQECFRVEYSVSVTTTKRSKQFNSYIMLNTEFDPSYGTELRLYYQSLEFTEITEEAIYTFENLMCDIGGAGGLFLGCSFATIFEFCDFSFDMLWLWFYRRNCRRQSNRISNTN